jgi:hypothetical protein
MALPRCPDSEFIELFETRGPHKAARALGVHPRNVQQRRQRLERKYHRRIAAPEANMHSGAARVIPAEAKYPGRLFDTCENGIVLIGSDAHYWPGEPSTAHRAFVKFCKEMKPAIVVMNGDVLDGATVSRHARIGWDSRPTLIDEIETCKDRLGEITVAAGKAHRFWSLGNHDCLSIQTECLTRRGWLRYCDIRKDDLILSKVQNGAVWSRITEIVTFPYVGPLVTCEKTRMSMAVTPNHRVLLKRLNWRTGHYELEEYRLASNLPSSFDLPMAAQVDNAGVELNDDQLSLAGWLLTDGSIDATQGVSLYQSKPVGVAAIETLLERLELSFSRYERQREARVICGRLPVAAQPLPSVQFRLKAESAHKVRSWVPTKQLPDWAHELSNRQFCVFLDALVAGDGTWDGPHREGKTHCVLYGRYEFLSSVQAVAVTHGWRARLATSNRGDHHLCMTKINKLRVERDEISTKPYAGTIWCLRVPHGNFMVRHNGCAYFTGNSRFETRLANIAPEYARIHGTALHDHFPDWRPCWSLFINNDVVVKHRFKGGMHATHNNTLWAGKTIITGHLHSLKVNPITDYDGTRFGVDTGCLAEIYAPAFQDYLEDNPRSWRSGFVVLTFNKGKLLWPEICHVIGANAVEFRGNIIEI